MSADTDSTRSAVDDAAAVPLDLLLGDAATGTRVLEDLYERERAAPMVTDLDAFWRSLGVPNDPLTEPFDDHAPLAAIRIAITRPHGL